MTRARQARCGAARRLRAVTAERWNVVRHALGHPPGTFARRRRMRPPIAVKTRARPSGWVGRHRRGPLCDLITIGRCMLGKASDDALTWLQ